MHQYLSFLSQPYKFNFEQNTNAYLASTRDLKHILIGLFIHVYCHIRQDILKQKIKNIIGLKGQSFEYVEYRIDQQNTSQINFNINSSSYWFANILQIINLHKMTNIVFREQPMVTSTTNVPIIRYLQDHTSRRPVNTPNLDIRYILDPKFRLQRLNQQLYEHSKSTLAYQSQTSKTSASSLTKYKMLNNDGTVQMINKTQKKFINFKDQTSNHTINFKRSGFRTPNKEEGIRAKAKSFVGRSQILNQEVDARYKKAPTLNSHGARWFQQEKTVHHSHHVSPQNLYNKAYTNYKRQIRSHRNSPNELLKNKNFDFFKTMKLKKQKNNSPYNHPKQNNQAEKRIYSFQKSNTYVSTLQAIKKSHDLTKLQENNQFSNKNKKSISLFSQKKLRQYGEKGVANHFLKRKIKIQDFQILDKLGKGALGEVFKAKQKYLGFMCVIKKISKKRIKTQSLQQMIIREIKLQSYLNHRHCTNIYGYFHDDQYVYLILELLPDASLQQVKKKRKLPQLQAIFIIHQVAEGLKYLHSQNVIHRDIKPQNIFMYEDYIKIGDFGCSIYHNQDGLRNSVVGCLEYFSPEQLFNEGYTEKIDSWSLGILSYELLYGKSPFQKQIKEILKGSERQSFVDINFPQDPVIRTVAKEFIRALLKANPQQRMSMDEALAHPFLSDIEKE